jgi:hypothetical protein
MLFAAALALMERDKFSGFSRLKAAAPRRSAQISNSIGRLMQDFTT